MSKLESLLLSTLICVVVLGNMGCTATTYRVGASQPALQNLGVETGDAVLVRYANETDSRSSSHSELILISTIGESGISGTGESGNEVDIRYEEVFQFEFVARKSAIKSDSNSIMQTGKVIEGASKIVGAAACIAAGVSGASC